jgi:hypothetical protein
VTQPEEELDLRLLELKRAVEGVIGQQNQLGMALEKPQQDVVPGGRLLVEGVEQH